MNHEEQDDLWELLGKARAPKERPFFAAKVLRAIQEDASREPAGLFGWWQAIRKRWAVTIATSVATVAAVIAAGILAFGPHAPKTTGGITKTTKTKKVDAPADPLAPLAAVADSSDDLLSSLDSLMATQDNSIWLADSPSPY